MLAVIHLNQAFVFILLKNLRYYMTRLKNAHVNKDGPLSREKDKFALSVNCSLDLVFQNTHT